MAIKLDVEEYCHDCVYFQAEVEPPTKLGTVDGRALYIDKDTTVRCSHANICHSLYRRLTKENNDD